MVPVLLQTPPRWAGWHQEPALCPHWHLPGDAGTILVPQCRRTPLCCPGGAGVPVDTAWSHWSVPHGLSPFHPCCPCGPLGSCLSVTVTLFGGCMTNPHSVRGPPNKETSPVPMPCALWALTPNLPAGSGRRDRQRDQQPLWCCLSLLVPRTVPPRCPALASDKSRTWPSPGCLYGQGAAASCSACPSNLGDSCLAACRAALVCCSCAILEQPLLSSCAGAAGHPLCRCPEIQATAEGGK